jgi:LysR family cyn operon transcriptional activator
MLFRDRFPVDLRNLRYFVSVAQQLSFSRAALHLNVSQSALSRQIGALEEELDVRLFDRIGRGIALTPAGEDLLTRSQAILHDVSAMKARAEELAGGTKGVLRLGATPQTIESLLARVLREYRRVAPGVDIALVEDGSGRLLQQVQSGAVHIAIGAYPSDGALESRVLFPLGVLAAIPADHPLATRKSIDVTDLANEPILLLHPVFMTRQLFDGACQITHLNPRVIIESGSPHCLLALADCGHGIAIIPSTVRLSYVRPRIVPLLLEGRQLGLWISAIWDPRRYLPPIARAFVDVLHDFTRRDYPGKAFRLRNLVDSSTAPKIASGG